MSQLSDILKSQIPEKLKNLNYLKKEHGETV